MGDFHNPEDESKYLLYFDVNKLYRWAMTQPLPYGGFRWVENVEQLFWDVSDDHHEGFILEVGLEYPEHLHDIHKDLPLCPECMTPPGKK